MPITEAPQVDTRTAFVRELFVAIKDSEATQAPYREAHERTIAEATAKAARRERMIKISKSKKGMRFPGSRPWQAAGFASRQAWLDHIDAEPQPSDTNETLKET